jgi:type II secretory pathway pseudopilin PulG
MNRPIQLDCTQNDGHRAGEEGFMLLAVVVMVAILLIALSVAAPVVARQLQRDKEVESQHRMEQYVRAVQLYQRKFPGQYPASIKVLESTNNVRFLRHVYIDPLTGKADYKLIHLGEQKTKIHVFFGQELGGLAASLGSAAGMQSGGGVGVGAGAMAGGSTNVTSTNALNSGFGGATIGAGSGTSSLGSTGSSDSSGTSGSNGTSGTNGTTSSTGTPGTNSAGTSSTSGTGSSSSSDSSIGSLGVIVGVGTSKSGTSITEPNAQTSYEAWEFWYDPRIEMLKQGVNVTGGGMTGGGGTPGSGMGSQSASSFGQNGATGQPNSPTNSSNSSTGTTGSNGTSGSTNPNSSVPNPF